MSPPLPRNADHTLHLEKVGITLGPFQLHDLSAIVPHASYTVLWGPSGGGKSTLVEAICGLRRLSSGRITCAGRAIHQLPPQQRGVAYVPQDLALFPGYDAAEQIAFALVEHGWSRSAINQRVSALAEQLSLHHCLKRYPESLSGGEAQRVALARALAPKPHVLCLDEPLSALDPASHAQACAVLQQLHRHTAITVLHITHNQAEAEQLATHTLTLSNGQLVTSSG